MPALLLELLHVFSVFWFVAGLLGRAAAQMQARRAADLRDVDAFLRMSSVFERAMVRPGSLVLLAAGVVTAFLKHWPFAGSPLTWVSASLLLYLSAFILIPLVFIPRGRHFRAAMADARAQGAVTPRLIAALRDRTVAMAHALRMAGGRRHHLPDDRQAVLVSGKLGRCFAQSPQKRPLNIEGCY